MTHYSAAWWARCACPRLSGRTLDDSPIVGGGQKWCYIISLNVVGRGGEGRGGEGEARGRGREEGRRVGRKARRGREGRRGGRKG